MNATRALRNTLADGTALALGFLAASTARAQAGYQNGDPSYQSQPAPPQDQYQDQNPGQYQDPAPRDSTRIRGLQDQGQYQQPPPPDADSLPANVAPPAIPDYDQPPCPGDGYIWTPGYWAWGPDGYYWVNGAWVLPPYAGALWTPGYWGALRRLLRLVPRLLGPHRRLLRRHQLRLRLLRPRLLRRLLERRPLLVQPGLRPLRQRLPRQLL